MLIEWLKKSSMLGIVREYRHLIEPASDISPAKHAQFLKITFDRMIYGTTALPFIAFFATLLYSSQRSFFPMAFWPLACSIFFFYRSKLRSEFESDALVMDGHALLSVWLPRLKRMAAVNGFALCLPFGLSALEPSFEFNVVWYMVIAAIVANHITQKTLTLGIFVVFVNYSWNIASLFVVIAFPDHWYYLLPLILMFTLSAFRHALESHKAFLQQMRLEESSKRLAEQFKEAKDIAEDALKAKNRFLATASHDLRQPVHAMSMLIEAISQRNQDSALSPALTDLRSSLRSMSSMFNSLLDLSKLESGVLNVEHKPVHLQPVLHDIVKMFEHDARDRQLQLRLHLPRQAAHAKTDINLLRQVILNLTQNALRYTMQGGVLLAVRRRGAEWQIEVCDTGIGVAKDMQSEIYLPYFRQQHAWGIDSEGHGLGLSVVARCAFLLKCPLDMASRLGRGSRFWIRVPSMNSSTLMPDSMGSDASALYPHYTALPPIQQGRCLIVEDDPQVSRGWRALMQSWGIEVHICSNSAEAFDSLKAGFSPQVILCDERLRAGESGFELLKALLVLLPDARGAMVSGEFNAPALMQAEDEGYLVLKKPVDIGLVHDLLSRWLISKK